jgi:hypothetical protein
MRISFLHTIENNRQVFEHAAIESGLRADDLRHAVRADLREAVDRAGTFPINVIAQTCDCLPELARNAEVVVVTCATLGPAVDEMNNPPVPVIRADAALAVEAAEYARRVGSSVDGIGR